MKSERRQALTPSRLLAYVGIMTAGAGNGGCSLLFVNGPPDDYATLSQVDCTSGRGWPVTDTVLGSIFVADAALAATGGLDAEDGGKKMSDRQRVGLGATFVGLAALTGYSAYYGFKNSAECREAQGIVGRKQGSEQDPGDWPTRFSYMMRTLESVPTETTYNDIEAAARKLGWRTVPAPSGDRYRLHFAAGDGTWVKIGDAFMDEKQTNAVILACGPPSPERCAKLVSDLFAAPVTADTPDDSRGGRLTCRRGGETMNVEVPPGALAALRDLPAKAGFAPSDCQFTPRDPAVPPRPAATAAPQSDHVPEPLPPLPITVTTATERVTLLAITRGREWKGIPSSTKLDLRPGDELVVVRYGTEPLPGRAAKGQDKLVLTMRDGSEEQPTSDVIVAVSTDGSAWAERAFVVLPGARLGALTINGARFDLANAAATPSP